MPNITSKTTMISARVPSSLVGRVDYVIRNLESAPGGRSAAVAEALEQWTSAQERELERLGIKAKKQA